MSPNVARGLASVYALFGAAALSGVIWLAGGCSSPESRAFDYDGPAPASAIAEQAKSGVMSDADKLALLERAGRLVRERAFATNVDFSQWDTLVAKYKDGLEQATTPEAYSRVLNRALNELGISHLDILPPKAAEERRREKYGGIGVTVNYNLQDQSILINDVREGSPAEKAGLQPGDVITEVDGNRVTEWGAIKGPAGTTVNITVKRAKDGSVSTFPIERADLSTGTPPKLELVGDDAAVLHLASFTEGYDRDKIEELIGRARDREMLIVDLRGNGGGSVTNLRHFLSLVLPPGTEVGAFVSKRDAQRYEDETGTNAKDAAVLAAKKSQKFRTQRGRFAPFDGKVAVLINGASASASEIFAAAMRELRSAPLVGTRTAGAVLLSTYVKMEGGFEMKVPTSDYVTVKGRRLEDSPLVPDVVARFAGGDRPRSAEQDRTVQEAIKALRGSAQSGKIRSE